MRFQRLRNQRVLKIIGRDLASGDPSLAGLLETFSKVTADEQMPGHEALRGRWSAGIRRVLRRGRLLIRS